MKDKLTIRGLCVLLILALLLPACGAGRQNEHESPTPPLATEAPVREKTPEEKAPEIRSVQSAPSIKGYWVIPLWIDNVIVDYAYRNEEEIFLDPISFLSAMGLEAETEWLDQEELTIRVPDCFELHAAQADDYLTVNGRYLYLPQGFLVSGARAFFPRDAVARMFGFVLPEMPGTSVRVRLEELALLEGGNRYYDVTFSGDDLYWLSHIIQAEAGNQKLDCMIGVGNVVLNRTKADGYPDTVFRVIYDYQNSAQFSPTRSKDMSQEVSELAWIATCLCMEGYETAKDCLYFQNPWGITPNWMTYAREYALTLGDMDFYY